MKRNICILSLLLLLPLSLVFADGLQADTFFGNLSSSCTISFSEKRIFQDGCLTRG